MQITQPVPHSPRIHAVLRARRLELGLTQAELARLAGMQQSVISRMESGASDPNAATIETLMAALGLVIAPAARRRGRR